MTKQSRPCQPQKNITHFLLIALNWDQVVLGQSLWSRNLWKMQVYLCMIEVINAFYSQSLQKPFIPRPSPASLWANSMAEMNGWSVILISLSFLAYAQCNAQLAITNLLIIKHTQHSLLHFLNLTRWQSQPDRCVLKTHFNICKQWHNSWIGWLITADPATFFLMSLLS